MAKPTARCCFSWSSITYLLFLLQASSSFVIHSDRGVCISTRSRASARLASASPQEAPQVPVVVVGTSEAALGAELALGAIGILTGQSNGDGQAQPVSLIRHQDCHSAALYQLLADLHSQYGSKPVLHLAMEPGALPREIMTPQISNSISFLGVHVNTATEMDTAFAATGTATVSPELARRCTENLKEILNWCSGDTKAVITLDLALHLSLLQAHCLPKSKHVLGDSYHVLLPEPEVGSVLVHYLYDEESFGSGTDPLCCQTREVLINTSSAGVTVTPGQTGAVSAGAYSALRGKGINSLDSACIATSVAASSRADVPPADHVGRIAELCRQVRRSGVKDAPGILRKKYKAVGYM